jgi:PAS domain-containing protein
VFNDYEVDHVFQNIGRKTILLNARQIFRKDIGSHIILLAMEDITERFQMHQALKERNKELNCLYSIITLFNFPDTPLDAILTRTVMLLPPAWQFSEICEARIIMNERSFQTSRFRETKQMLEREILEHGSQIGRVSVCYLEERPSRDSEPFLREEHYLLTIIAEKLGTLIESHRAESEIRKLSRMVEQSPVVIEITDLQGTIEYVNPKFTEISGYEAREAVGQNINMLRTDGTPPEIYDQLSVLFVEDDADTGITLP